MRNEEFENIQNFVFCDQKIHFTKFMKKLTKLLYLNLS